MLEDVDIRLGPEVGTKTSTEVKVKPCEIQFSEVSAVVHVAEVVDVGSGADGVGHGLISHSNWTSEYGSQPGVG